MTGYLRLSLLLCALSLSFGTLRAQEILSDSAASRMAAMNTINSYHQFMGDESRLYNGIEHYGYPTLKGHPYFLQDSMHTGSLVYEDCWYPDVQLSYDIVRDELVTLSLNDDLTSLAANKVKEFFLLGHHFINTPIGYCDLLCSGKLTLQAKRIKRILEVIEDFTIVRNIEVDNQFYILKDGVSYPIGKQSSMFALMKDKHKEINQDLRRKKIKYRKDRESALIEAVTFYNQLSQ